MQRAIILTTAMLLSLTALARAEQTRLYGPDGRSAGTIVTYGNGSQRYYDAQGRSVGTSSTTSSGMTTYYDARGKVIGRTTNGR